MVWYAHWHGKATCRCYAACKPTTGCGIALSRRYQQQMLEPELAMMTEGSCSCYLRQDRVGSEGKLTRWLVKKFTFWLMLVALMQSVCRANVLQAGAPMSVLRIELQERIAWHAQA